MSESKEQLRFRIFAMTHKSPTQAADEWLADKERIQQLETMLLRWQNWNDDPRVIDRELEEDTRQLLLSLTARGDV